MLFDNEFANAVSAAVDAGEIPEAMFDEIADRRAAAEKALHDYAASLGDARLTGLVQRVMEA